MEKAQLEDEYHFKNRQPLLDPEQAEKWHFRTSTKILCITVIDLCVPRDTVHVLILFFILS